ncbi:MAG: HAD-IIB family hydrolase [Bacilli bacterium]|jgi:Cof subfamily protein (haloacid dehalogenase superfamily)|nr:HAD-IIB family hydrolase [Bacilli bacterium]
MKTAKPKILACDLDGTLFYPKQKKTYLSKKNVEFLQKFIDQGNKVVLVSSRSENFIKKVIHEIDRPVDYIACTGAKISVDGQLIVRRSIDGKKLAEILNEVEEEYHPLACMLISERFPIIIKSLQPMSKVLMSFYALFYRLHFGIYREDFVYDNDLFDKELEEGEVYGAKIAFGVRRKKNKISKEINKQLREKYQDIEASWVGIVIEFTPVGCNKANGITRYVNHLNISDENVYVVGDSGNDISMFLKYHENSFVMKHAYPSVKKYAKHEISRVYKLDKYVFGKEKINE